MGDQKSEMYSFAIEIDFFVKDYDTFCEKVDILIIDCFPFLLTHAEENLKFSKKRLEESRGPNSFLPSLKPTIFSPEKWMIGRR